MLRSKRRRTRMHDSKGNPIFNTNNATSKQNNYVMKNNYLESLKIKGNDHNKCKRYYSDKEVIEKHQINLKDSSLIINFSSYDFTWRNDSSCEYEDTFAFYNNTTQFSGIYKFLGNYTYYNISPVDCTIYGDSTIFKSVVFLTFVPFPTAANGIWGIMGLPFDETMYTFEDSVKEFYNDYIVETPPHPEGYFTQCSTLSRQNSSNDITKYYQSTWNEKVNTNTSISVSMTPDTNHSHADKIKQNMTFRYCKTSIEQNPILGYRKQLLVCENSFEDIIITYNKLIKDGKIDISFNSIPFTFEYPLGGTFSSNMNLFNGVYKHDGNAYINENNSSFGFAYITGDKIWKFINQYTESNQAIQIIITSNKTDIFDIIKLNGINLNWTITIKINGISIQSDEITPSTFTSDLSVKYDEIHVKVSKIIKKFLQGAAIKNPTNTIYKDNYAKTCGKFRKEDSSLGKFCAYNNVILTKQNNNGIVDPSYNYSTSQYLSRPNFMKCNNVYKKSNPRFSTQGAVSGGSRLNRLKYQTIVKSQQKYNTLGNTLFQFKFKVGYREPTTQLKLYGYGNGTGIGTIPGSLKPDNFKGNEIPTLNITENSYTKTYGLQIYFNKRIEDQISENMLNNFKIILNYNDINIQINFSDLTQFYNYGVQVEYDFDYDDTNPNYNLIKNIIGNGEIIGKTVNVIFVFNKLTSENILTIKKLLNNKNISNMVNGVYPTNLYRNTRPIYKQIYSKNVKCKGRSCNGLLQFCPN